MHSNTTCLYTIPLLFLIILQVVNRIAAGEVIQRPCNALKELIENSLDAGASDITITLGDGGLSYLQITDNGHGIRHEDFPLLCERFTTSKLRSFSDLKSIATFGFRGEALASLTHVCKVSITSMSSEVGTKYAYTAHYIDSIMVPSFQFNAQKNTQLSTSTSASTSNAVVQPTPSAGVKGTSIIAQDMFYNIPVRRSALKSALEEYTRCLEVIQSYSIQFPKVSFTCKKKASIRADYRSYVNSSSYENIKQIYNTALSRELIRYRINFPNIKDSEPSLIDKNTTSTSSTSLSNTNTNTLASIMSELEQQTNSINMTVQGYVTNGNYSYSGKRTMQCILFINNRLIECISIKHAIENIYATILPKNAVPFIYLSITLPPHNIDVNVHPTKKQVHFLYEDQVISNIVQGLELLLMNANDSRVFTTTQLTFNSLQTPSQMQTQIQTQSLTQEADLTTRRSRRRSSHSTTIDTEVLDEIGFTEVNNMNESVYDDNNENNGNDDNNENDDNDNDNDGTEDNDNDDITHDGISQTIHTNRRSSRTQNSITTIMTDVSLLSNFKYSNKKTATPSKMKKGNTESTSTSNIPISQSQPISSQLSQLSQLSHPSSQKGGKNPAYLVRTDHAQPTLSTFLLPKEDEILSKYNTNSTDMNNMNNMSTDKAGDMNDMNDMLNIDMDMDKDMMDVVDTIDTIDDRYDQRRQRGRDQDNAHVPTRQNSASSSISVTSSSSSSSSSSTHNKTKLQYYLCNNDQDSLPLRQPFIPTPTTPCPPQSLQSILELISECKLHRHPDLQTLFSHSTYVGSINPIHTMIQHSTSLMLVHIPSLSRQFFYERILTYFQYFSTIELKKPVSVAQLLYTGLYSFAMIEKAQNTNTLDDLALRNASSSQLQLGVQNDIQKYTPNQQKIIVQHGVNLLTEKIELLKEYFSLYFIDQNEYHQHQIDKKNKRMSKGSRNDNSSNKISNKDDMVQDIPQKTKICLNPWKLAKKSAKKSILSLSQESGNNNDDDNNDGNNNDEGNYKNEYIYIENDIYISHIPLLLPNYIPPLAKLPQFLVSLVYSAFWESEKSCFKSISLILAEFYAFDAYGTIMTPTPQNNQENSTQLQQMMHVSSPGSDDIFNISDISHPDISDILDISDSTKIMQHVNSHVSVLQGPWISTITDILLPAMKDTGFVPPKDSQENGHVLELTRLQDLYKVFERC